MGSLLETHHIPHKTVMKAMKCKDAFIVCTDPQQREEAKRLMEAVINADGKAAFKSLRNAVGWVQRERKVRKRARPDSPSAASGSSDAAPSTTGDDASLSPPSSPTSSRYARPPVVPAGPTPASSSLSISDVVTPYHSLPYPTQLKRKLRQAAAALKAATKGIRALDPSFTPFHQRNHHNQDILCDLSPPVPSPVLEGYRNKCEFSLGRDREGGRVAGFLLGKYTEGMLAVAPVDDCVHVSAEGKRVAQGFTAFLQTSPHEVYDRATHTGVWRMLTVRNTRHGEAMAVVQLDPKALSEEQLQAVHAQLLHHFTTVTPVQSLYVQHNSGLSNSPTTPPILLHGAAYLTETLSSLSFRVSPSSFFQTNTAAAEVLFAHVHTLASLTPTTTLLDVCCGTGTIGQVLARHVAEVIGLELIPDAVSDARTNAQLNGLTNARYVEGKVEDTMEGVLRGLEEGGGEGRGEVVAVVDPPRGGLHGSVVRVLRECQWLKRVVYVSCNPKSLADNLVTLCQRESKRVKGPPFIAKQAMAVDLFPHTEHVEMIVLLERGDEEERRAGLMQESTAIANASESS